MQFLFLKLPFPLIPNTLLVTKIPYYHKRDAATGGKYSLTLSPTYDKCTVFLGFTKFTFITIKGEQRNPHQIWPPSNQQTLGLEVPCFILRP